MADKELRVKITGTAEKFQEALKQAERGVNEFVRGASNRLSGGLLGGTAENAAQVILDTVMKVLTRVEAVVSKARDLGVSGGDILRRDRFAQLAGAGSGSTDSAIDSARRVRADALAGDDDAARVFEKINLALEDIKDLKPDELFDRILKSAAEAPLNAERFYSYSKLFGRDFAERALPIATSPKAMETLRNATSGFGANAKMFTALESSGMMGFGDSFKEAIDRQKNRFEPFSEFGIRQREQAEFMSEQNRQRAEQVGRSMLTTEERINEVIAERLRISRLITEENDPIKRQKFVGDAIAVESELAALTQKREGELTVKGSPRATDPLRQIGADFSRYGPSLTADIGKQQVTEIQRLRSSLESGLERVRAAIAQELN